MTTEDLESVTGFVRYSKQVDWFKRELRVSVARRSDGSPVITWETFNAIQKKRAGVTSEPIEEQRPLLRPEKLRAVK
ncbi:DUF4224 domain-containing protein [Paraburkholderia sp. BL9I2N2]|uniref:DUF4224 domain-containing protein n=1 Tax=Paraburkholderia sp. BL9I2N2 TaxID=1938809 RepID=UPI0010EBA48A|nr:DUF4224 domain-containing protein [Paraburkholderia sp. BL9I2N2]TCK87312.1 uncharacterized protein DUF4224 [Paraburkholderia sp. BL9I2N2]